MASRAGVPNRVGSDMRRMLLHALQMAGKDAGGRGRFAGAKYLHQQAKANPNAFMALLGKVIPTEITGDGQPVLLEQIVLLALERRAEEAGTQSLAIPGAATQVTIEATALPAPTEPPSAGEGMGRKPAATKTPQKGSGRSG